jgi:hypothetical protein
MLGALEELVGELGSGAVPALQEDDGTRMVRQGSNGVKMMVVIPVLAMSLVE